MSMSDPIADLLTRIRNASRVGHATVDIPRSNVKVEIVRVLKLEGFIADFTVTDTPAPGMIRVELKYTQDREPVLQGLRRVSKPSFRVFRGASDLKPIRSGLGVSIVSTSRGVMTGKAARTQKVGGEVICEIW